MGVADDKGVLYMKCRYCEREYNYCGAYAKGICASCSIKFPLRFRFAKARDDLRELCGLERLGDLNDR